MVILIITLQRHGEERGYIKLRTWPFWQNVSTSISHYRSGSRITMGWAAGLYIKCRVGRALEGLTLPIWVSDGPPSGSI